MRERQNGEAMSRNSELWTRPERWDAMTSRRAEAMSRHFELETGQGPSPQYSKEFNRPVYPPQSHSNNSEHTDWLRAIDILKKHWRLSAALCPVAGGGTRGVGLNRDTGALSP